MADFYGSVAGFKTYHTARGNAFEDNDPSIQSALYRGSASVDGLGVKPMPDGSYMTLWPGIKTGGRQQLRAWPRDGGADNEGNEIPAGVVPVEVEQATYEMALREQVAPGSTAPDYNPSGLVKREKVDVLETEYFGASDVAPGANPVRPVISVVMELLAPLLLPDYTGTSVFAV